MKNLIRKFLLKILIRLEGKEVSNVLIVMMAEQVLSGKIRIEQIGNAFNLRTLVEQKIAEMLGQPEGE